MSLRKLFELVSENEAQERAEFLYVKLNAMLDTAGTLNELKTLWNDMRENRMFDNLNTEQKQNIFNKKENLKRRLN